MRRILVVVGLSLLDKIRELEKLAKPAIETKYLDKHIRDVITELHSLGGALSGIQNGSVVDPPERYADFGWLEKKYPGVNHLVHLLRYLWQDTTQSEALQRKTAPAELASLSLLPERISDDDEVCFLYSETHASAFCSAVLSEALRLPPDANSRLCIGQPSVRQQMLAGVQVRDAAKLAQQGFASLVQAIYDAHQQTDGRTLWVNITGGYKGVAPLVGTIALALSEPGNLVQVFYLYEESDELILLPGSSLFRLDLSLFRNHKSVWSLLEDDLRAGRVRRDDVTETVRDAALKAGIISDKDDKEGRFVLTATGHLLFEIWQRKLSTQATPTTQGAE